MRLRLLERLGRLVGWRFGSQGDRNSRSRDSRAAGAEASGRIAGTPARSARATARPRGSWRARRRHRRCSRRRACRDGTRSPQACPAYRGRAGQRRSHAAAAAQLRPRPGRRHRAGTDQGGALRRCPLDTAARPVPGADQAPRQPWYQVVGGAPAARRLAGQAGRAGRPTPATAWRQEGAGQGRHHAGVRRPRAAAFRPSALGQLPGDGRRAAELRTA